MVDTKNETESTESTADVSKELASNDYDVTYDSSEGYSSDFSNDSDRSIEIILRITGTTPFHLMRKKEEGYSFITQNITNLDEEIKNFKAGGEVITWWTYELPPNIGKPLYIVKVWLKDWTDTEVKRYLLAGKEVKIIQKIGYWKLKYINEIPF